jgi:Protein of unknown function (DUF2934)
MHPEHRTIGELAYRIWQDRGCPEGSAEQDWLDAEKQLGAEKQLLVAQRPTAAKLKSVPQKSVQQIKPSAKPPG